MSQSPRRRSQQQRSNFQAQADELGDNYFVSFSKTEKKDEHWTYWLTAGSTLLLMGWQIMRFRRDFIAHSMWTIFDGFILLILLTVLCAILMPRERDPNAQVASTVLVHESTIFQKGRLPVMREFSNFVNGDSTWWVNNVATLLARYVDTGKEDDNTDDDDDDDNSDDDDDLALIELEEVLQRVINLIYRIIRNSEAPKVLRRMLREEAKMYLEWLVKDGFIFNWMSFLPESLGDYHFDPRLSVPKTKLLDDHESKRYRLWLKQFLAAHLFKRHLWSQTPSAYPNFSQKCIVCQERDVEVAFIGCGHAVTCGDCGRMCLYGNHSSSGLCPLCRCPIEVLSDDSLSRKDR